MNTERLEALEKQASKLETRRDILEEQQEKLESKIEEHKREIAVQQKIEELFKYLLNEMVYRYAKSFSEVTTEGLQKIFTDQELSFRVDVEQRYGKVALDFVTIDGEIEGDTLESFGGGPASVESLILRLLVLLRAGLARYLFLDESLASLSEQYVPRCGEFLQQMCDRMDVDILLITHNQSFLEYADTAYRAGLDSEGWLKVEELTQ